MRPAAFGCHRADRVRDNSAVNVERNKLEGSGVPDGPDLRSGTMFDVATGQCVLGQARVPQAPC
jgi:hypothetical protein